MTDWGMTRTNLLSADDLEDALILLHSDWSVSSEGTLHRELRFADFAAAFGFMSEIAIVAEKLDHPPEWSNVYSTVKIDLTTHDAGGLTQLDVALATAVDAAALGSR